MPKVIPAIIPQSFDHLRGQVMQVKDYVPRVQVDIVDGEYAPNSTWPYEEDDGEFADMISQTMGLPYWREVTYEFDLMIDNPADVISDYIQIGASGIIIHYSSTDDLFSLLEDIQDAQMDAGVALVPKNFAENIDISNIARIADFIQLMGNDDIGKHGVSLDPDIYEYIRDIRDIDESIDIAIDIGVNHTTAPELTAAGATTLVSGSSIFGAPDIEQAIIELEKA